jgi:hypothetical protein
MNVCVLRDKIGRKGNKSEEDYDGERKERK